MEQRSNETPYAYQSPWVQRGEPTLKAAPALQQSGESTMRNIMKFLGRPAISTLMVLLFAGFLSYMIFSSYPSGSDENTVPVIKAETKSFRERPQDVGGAQVPFQDNTIYAAIDEVKNRPVVENLLEETSQVEAQEVESAVEELQNQISAENSERDTSTAAEEIAQSQVQEQSQPQIIEIPETPVKEIVQENVQQSVESTPTKPKVIHKPGASPETLAFVRSVLDQKDEKAQKAVTSKAKTMAPIEYSASAQAMAAVEPSTGAATNADGGHSYFIQLASIQNEAAASSEWAKMAKGYDGLLSNSSYRVQKADLGVRGMFYRIQAGPYSKSKADEICGAIKAQKPGSCFVVR